MLSSSLIENKNEICQKLIWRTWGHDIRPNTMFDSDVAFRNILKHSIYPQYKFKVRQFKAIGIANDVDAVNLSKVFGDFTTVILNYSYNQNLDELLEIKNQEKIHGKPFRILIGHSRSPMDCHIDALKRLLLHSKENIQICLILSYGGPKEYGDKLNNTQSGTMEIRLK